MKTLYFDLGMGAAGDMLTAALLELLPDPEAFVKKLNELGIPGIEYVAEKSVKCGITGTHMSVLVNGEEESEAMHEHHHHHHDGEDGEEHEHGHHHHHDDEDEEHEHHHHHHDHEAEEHVHEHDEIHEHVHEHHDDEEHDHEHHHHHHDEEEHEHEHEHHHHHHDEEEHEHEHEHHHHHHDEEDYDHEHGHHHHHHDEEDHDHEHEHHHHHHDEEDHDHEHEHHHHHDEEDHDHGHEHTHDHEHTHSHGGHTHSHNGIQGIEHIVRDHLALPEKVLEDVLAVYHLIAEAESHAHDMPITEVHFHEVGTMDAIADVVAVCMLINEIAPDKIVASPVHVGAGKVRAAHGVLPVPAPATAFILKDVPIYGGRIQGELCTPTGAALLKHFVQSFGDMPVMQVEKIGYGMGRKDFEAANCVRALLGESDASGDVVCELTCNVDDMTGEMVGHAMEELFAAGAFEVYTVSVGMKKSRPGIMFCVMCREEDKDKMIKLIFRHTTTIGIRENISRRYTLDREMENLRTPYGYVRRKTSRGYGVERSKLEYDDIARISRETGKSISDIRKELENL